MDKIKQLESGLNSFDPEERASSLDELCLLLKSGEVTAAPVAEVANMHCHTFFSHNGYNLSPSRIAWMAKVSGWLAAGVVDFDVLDGIDEFLAAGAKLDSRTVGGIETRVFIPEFADREINSPGEPGISYHMGMGFAGGAVPDEAAEFADRLRKRAADRTRKIVQKVNNHLGLIKLNYDNEIVPLTPAGNATERHVCQAYYTKAEESLPDLNERARFWSDKLDMPLAEMKRILPDPVKTQALIRSKTMKLGGVGYVKPKPSMFPELKEMNEFIKQCGALPVMTWLNGLSNGEQALDELLYVHAAKGMAAVNIIPDRNWNVADPDEKAIKVKELNRFVKAATDMDLPVIVGTEMNAPGLKLIDDFDSEALRPHLKTFLDGAAVMVGHTLLSSAGMGYLDEWAAARFPDRAMKNRFYAEFGRAATPGALAKLGGIKPDSDPDELLGKFLADSGDLY